MSHQLILNNLDENTLTNIEKDLCIHPEKNKYSQITPEPIYAYAFNDKYVYIPFYYGNSAAKRRERKEFDEIKVVFQGTPRPEQKEVQKEAIACLNKKGSVIISAYPAFGKTFLSLWVATKIKLKTMIIIHRIVLIKQWVKSIEQFCPGSIVQVIEGKTEIDTKADFFVMNPANVSKHGFMPFIGFLIVDEAHLIMAEKLSECMRYFSPRYLLGLSATPYRKDGLNALFDLYFGPERIYRELWRHHTVYTLNTNFIPEVKTNKQGRVDWGSLLESQGMNEKRNGMIVKIIKTFPKRVFLVLCKRVEQAKILIEKLRDEKEDVTYLYGTRQDYEQTSRILVGTTGKVSVGFDHPKLDSMILATDIEGYFLQVLGRIFRNPHSRPMIFDIIDKNPLLFRHFITRKNTYLKHGGELKDFKTSFPDFPIPDFSE